MWPKDCYVKMISLSNFQEHHSGLAFLYSRLLAKVKRLPFILVKLVVLTPPEHSLKMYKMLKVGLNSLSNHKSFERQG